MARRQRPTFSESWYRVAELRPRLHPAVQVFRQQYRGQMWFVVRDPANNQFFRVPEAGYEFIGLLDGSRTVTEAWQITMDRLGDMAPTQGEAIQLLGQLYTSNLLQGDLPPDASGMFERRRKRVQREIRSYATNLLFVRFPLWDPDRLLNRWVGVVGWVFGPIGFALLAILAATGIYFITQRGWDELIRASDPQSMLRTENLLWLYGGYAVIKLVHELGHAFACKHFGRDSRAGGEVHTIGLMLLVFMPVPYVDASSSWAFRSKWQRAIVAGAGIYIEIAIASIAAVVWASTPQGSLASDLSHNLIFLASVSTLLFNGNPLLRYDGYYILSDVLEIPNLAMQSKQYLYYLTRKYAFGVRDAVTNVRSVRERFWFVTYGIASTVYRMVIFAGILLYVSDMLFVLGTLMAAFGLITWAVVPLCKFAHYLLTNGELHRTRSRAMLVTVGTLLVFAGLIGLVPLPDHCRAEGYVQSRNQVTMFTAEGGIVQSALADGAIAEPGSVLLQAKDIALQSRHDQLLAQRASVLAQYRLATATDPAEARIHADQLQVVDRKIERVEDRLDQLKLVSPIRGVWVAHNVEYLVGSYVKRGEQIGTLVDPHQAIIRVVTDQYLGPRLAVELGSGPENPVAIRPFHRPDVEAEGYVERILPAGSEQLPSPVLGMASGGSTRVDTTDQHGTRTAEPFFEVVIKPADVNHPLRCGQRVVVRFALPDKPLAQQWWLALRQLLQRRFQI